MCTTRSIYKVTFAFCADAEKNYLLVLTALRMRTCTQDMPDTIRRNSREFAERVFIQFELCGCDIDGPQSNVIVWHSFEFYIDSNVQSDYRLWFLFCYYVWRLENNKNNCDFSCVLFTIQNISSFSIFSDIFFLSLFGQFFSSWISSAFHISTFQNNNAYKILN